MNMGDNIIKGETERLRTHRWHNGFHLEMPVGLINDPNGLSFYQGEYHIFYQWNPTGCEQKNKHWGHVATRDFIHYTAPVVSLQPSDWFDKDGCYSGCAFVEDEQLRVIYTGNVKNEKNERESYQCLGEFQPDGTIRKAGVLISHQPPGYTAHFRDPYVFFRGGAKYMVLGAQTDNLSGRALLYKQADDKWAFVGEIKTALENFGYMWECPNLLDFDGQDVLLFSPQGLPARAYGWQNLYQSGYVCGQLELGEPLLCHASFEEIDHGFDFYAPQGLEHQGRKLLLGWIGMPEREGEYPTAAEGWLYSLTMPRELELKSGRLYQQPARELRDLRKTAVPVGVNGKDGFEISLPRQAELDLTLVWGQAESVSYTLYFGSDKLVFSYASATGVFCIDRNSLRLGGKGERRFKLAAAETLRVQLFIDRAVVECFLQQGEKAATSVYFPEKECLPLLHVRADRPWTSLMGTIWELGSFCYEDAAGDCHK